MKRIFCVILSLLLLCGCSVLPDKNKAEENAHIPIPNEDIKGVWIFYRELSMEKDGGGTEESFKSKIDNIFDNCVKFGINTVFVHVRAFSDSFYPSKIFPWSKYLTGVQGKSVEYDPLKIMLDSAHQRGLSFHAWINPFRISLDNDESKLSNDNIAKKWLNDNDTAKRVYKADTGIYFDPANASAQKLIIDGVREIAENYDVDGIHIDDYFYPTTDAQIDKTEYNEYTSLGGKLGLSDWRREVVSSFISGMYSAIKSADKSICFSISPAGNFSNNYNSLYADVIKWGNESGYCDVLIPQLYYGFEHKKLPFKEVSDDWCNKTDESKVKLVAGLAAYKTVEPQKGEWETDIILRQIDYASSQKQYSGYCLFSYSSIISEYFNKNNNLSSLVSEPSVQSGG